MKKLSIKFLTLGVFCTVALFSTPTFAATKNSGSMTKSTQSVILNNKTSHVLGAVNTSDYYKTIRRGSRGKLVGDLQHLLNYLSSNYNQPSWNCGDEDQIFGGSTERAVKAFQRSRGLDADGVVGPATWSAMFDMTA